jgi:hypothetical protein
MGQKPVHPPARFQRIFPKAGERIARCPVAQAFAPNDTAGSRPRPGPGVLAQRNNELPPESALRNGQ